MLDDVHSGDHRNFSPFSKIRLKSWFWMKELFIRYFNSFLFLPQKKYKQCDRWRTQLTVFLGKSVNCRRLPLVSRVFTDFRVLHELFVKSSIDQSSRRSTISAWLTRAWRRYERQHPRVMLIELASLHGSFLLFLFFLFSLFVFFHAKRCHAKYFARFFEKIAVLALCNTCTYVSDILNDLFVEFNVSWVADPDGWSI